MAFSFFHYYIKSWDDLEYKGNVLKFYVNNVSFYIRALCDPMDWSPPGSSVRGIFQARIVEWVAIPFSRGSSKFRDQIQVSCAAGRFFTVWATKAAYIRDGVSLNSSVFTGSLNQCPENATAKLLQSCPTLCDPIDSSPPGSPIPGILQARTLEWVAISFSQCMKVKSECEIAQSCPTLHDSMDCSLPDSSIHGIFQARVMEWGAIAFSGPENTKGQLWVYQIILLYTLTYISYMLIKSQ